MARRVAVLFVIAMFAFPLAAAAHIRGLPAGIAVQRLGHALGAASTTIDRCPAGMPVQTISVVNQANVRPWALAKVENAVVAQSLQVRAAWATPCVQFGAGGWPLQLLIGDVFSSAHGAHYQGAPPSAVVWTSGSPWPGWSVAFSHEVVEMLVDPEGLSVFYNGEGVAVEVADPVEDQAYRLAGVYVTDFVLPSWFAGGMQTASCNGSSCSYSNPLLDSSVGWPYDRMHVLGTAWQLTPGVDSANVD